MRGSQRSTHPMPVQGRTELLVKAGKLFQARRALQVWGLRSDHGGAASAHTLNTSR